MSHGIIRTYKYIYKYSILTSFKITNQDKEKNMVQKPLHPKSEGEAATSAAV